MAARNRPCAAPREPLRRTLCAQPGLRVDDFRCRACVAPRGAEEPNEGHSIVFVRRGLFLRESRDGTSVGDANRVLFFHRGEGYRYAHPVAGGDDCTILALDEATAWSLVEEAELAREGARGPFPVADAVAGARMAALHQELLRELALGADALALAELALELARAALAGLRPAARGRRPTRAQRELVEAARLALARRPDRPPSLTALARELGCSPFHLSRLFRAATGLGLRQHVRRLRVRLAAERLRRGSCDLSALAQELGFHDHSHFTHAFRAEWGCAPSRFARSPRPRQRP